MGGFAWNPLLWWMGMPQTTPNASSFRNWALRIYAPPNGWQLGWFIVDQRDMNWHGVDQMTLSLLDSEHRPWVVKEEAHIYENLTATDWVRTKELFFHFFSFCFSFSFPVSYHSPIMWNFHFHFFFIPQLCGNVILICLSCFPHVQLMLSCAYLFLLD